MAGKKKTYRPPALPEVDIEPAEGLNARQDLFCREFIVDLIGGAAAIRCGYSPATAYQQASALLKLPKIIERIAELKRERLARLQITADDVLSHYWTIAKADANEIIQYRRVNCRHCWGEDHDYQWTELEFREACNKIIEKEGLGADLPETPGGLGFNLYRDPNPGCPQCYGKGDGLPFMEDTRKLSHAGKLLYRGVKVTKEGLVPLLANQDDAMAQVVKLSGLIREGGTIINATLNQNTVTQQVLAVTSDDVNADLAGIFGRAAIGLAEDEDEGD